MTIDKEQLKALAEQVIAEQKVGFGNAAMAAFHEAATPGIILALLGEIELLSKNPLAQAVDALATAAARHLATEAKGCLEKGLLETIEQVKAENEALQERLDLLGDENTALLDRIERVEAESGSLRKDAQRYRYVRDCAYGVATIDGYRIMFEEPMPEGPLTSSAEKLDLAVDAGMSQEAGHD